MAIGEQGRSTMAATPVAPRAMGRLLALALLSGALALLVVLPRISQAAVARGNRAPVAAVHASATIMVSEAGCGPRELQMAGPGDLSITLHNHGRAIHSLTIAGMEGTLIAEADGGSATSVFTIPRPGTYTYSCAPPGQSAALSQGTLTVGDGTHANP